MIHINLLKLTEETVKVSLPGKLKNNSLCPITMTINIQLICPTKDYPLLKGCTETKGNLFVYTLRESGQYNKAHSWEERLFRVRILQ